MAKQKQGKLYVGIDVGGTKIMAALVKSSGKILARRRETTPRGQSPEETLATVANTAEALLAEAGVDVRQLRGLGLAVPGIVDADEGRVVITPNMNLTGLNVVEPMRRRFNVPIALGNDVNLGTLGEQWLGAAALADSAVGIFVGTGIGGGIIANGRLIVGHRGAAAEVGHLRMQPDGPLCGCGNRGCLEALASRTAIERNIREAVAAGRTTSLVELVQGDLSVIRSNALKKTLQDHDPLVTEVMTHAAETLGEACLQIMHLLDPEVIVLGGGVIEACKFFMVPLVQKVMERDPFLAVRRGGKIVISVLGDDAVVLGAVALAQQVEGRDPFRRSLKVARRYPPIDSANASAVVIGGREFRESVAIRANGKVKLRRELNIGQPISVQLGAEELDRVCKGGPCVLILGTALKENEILSAQAERFLLKRGVTYEILPIEQAAVAYNATKGRKAMLACL